MHASSPFFHRGPIRDRSYFFGREPLLSRLLASLRQGQSVALVGPRRIGKTSLLLRVLEAAEPGFHCLYVDCERLASHTPAQVSALLADTLGRNLDGHDTYELAPQDPFVTLDDVVRRAAAAGTQLVLLLDEFESLTAHPQLDGAFFGSLRALAMEHGLAYVTVSTRPLLELTAAQVHPRGSPFFNFFAQLRIGLFTRAESLALLQKLSARGGHPFNPEFCAQLIAGVGDHPFFLQMIADHAFERVASGEAQSAELAEVVLRGPFRSEATDHWQYFWRGLAEPDQRLLALLPARVPHQQQRMQRLAEAALISITDAHEPPLVPLGFRAFVAEQPVAGLLQAPPIVLDLNLRLVLVAGQSLQLTPQQFDLLAYLLTHRDRVVPSDELAAAFWQQAEQSSHDSLRTTLKDLRKALGPAKDCVQNVRGQGYQFVESSAPPSP